MMSSYHGSLPISRFQMPLWSLTRWSFNCSMPIPLSFISCPLIVSHFLHLNIPFLFIICAIQFASFQSVFKSLSFTLISISSLFTPSIHFILFIVFHAHISKSSILSFSLLPIVLVSYLYTPHIAFH